MKPEFKIAPLNAIVWVGVAYVFLTLFPTVIIAGNVWALSILAGILGAAQVLPTLVVIRGG